MPIKTVILASAFAAYQVAGAGAAAAIVTARPLEVALGAAAVGAAALLARQVVRRVKAQRRVARRLANVRDVSFMRMQSR